MTRHEEKPCITLTQPSTNKFFLVFTVATAEGTSDTWCMWLQFDLILFLSLAYYLVDQKQFLQVSIPICFQPEWCLLNDCAFPNSNMSFVDQTQMKRGSKDTEDWREAVPRCLHSSSVIYNSTCSVAPRVGRHGEGATSLSDAATALGDFPKRMI